jgi:putative nucleotidyltransferase with HDIG domain
MTRVNDKSGVDLDARIHLEHLLFCPSPDKRWIRDRLVELLGSQAVVPSFSNVAVKLMALIGDENVTLDDLGEVISLDPGMAARCLRLASSAVYRGRAINTINEALLRIGLVEVRRIALTLGVIEAFSHLRIKIDWHRFWLHSVLVARLTEKIAGAFRDVTGAEYLAGLLHDIGKMIVEHHFPREFEAIVLRAMERHCGHAAAEQEVLGLDHAQIGAAMCFCLKLHPHILQAVCYHHNPLHPAHTDNPEGDGGFLSACLSAADTLTNVGQVNIGGEKELDHPFADLPEWAFLNQWFNCRGLDLDLNQEIEKAELEIQSLGLSTAAAAPPAAARRQYAP